MIRTLVISACLAMSGLAAAQDSAPALSPEMEQTAREIGESLRCVVCQNQSIEESDADLAADMRVLVRTRVAQGDTPEQVRAYIRDRYGDYVLLKPPVQNNTLVLWIVPFVLLLGFLAYFLLRFRRTSMAVREIENLSAAEREDLAALRRKLETERRK